MKELSNKEIKNYLNDWDNLEETGWFDNPKKDISSYTFYNKDCENLNHFLSKGRNMITQLLAKKEINKNEWITIEKASLVKGEMINFLEFNNGDGLHPPTQTVHIGWMENEKKFYSESADEYIDIKNITLVHKIESVPNTFVNKL